MKHLLFCCTIGIALMVACGASGPEVYKLPSTIRDSACVACMPYYIDQFPKMGDDSVIGMFARYNTMPIPYRKAELDGWYDRDEVDIYIYI